MARAGETAGAFVSALKRGEKGNSGGSDQFFTQSAINFLAAFIYFLAHKRNVKYSSLPHLLAFLSRHLNYWIKNTCSFTGKSKSVIHGPSSIRAFKPVAFFGTVKTNTVPID
jgi:hypothetical protein